MSETITGTSFPSQPETSGIVGAGGMHQQRIDPPATYWLGRFSNAPVLNLPTDKPRVAKPAANFAWQSRRVDRNLAEGLRQFGQSEQIAFSVVLLSAFQVLLLRYTSQDDVVIGCALPDLSTGVDGAQASTQAAFLLRADVSGDPAFRDLVSRVYGNVLEAREQARPSLAELSEEMSSALGVQAPTFQVSFSYRTERPPMEWQPIPSHGVTPDVPVDLHLDIGDDGEEFSLRLLHNQDLFEAPGIARTLQNLETLLRSIVRNPDQRLWDLPILTEQEQRQVVVEWNQNVQHYASDKCLHELVEANAERAPDQLAVVWGDRQLTYQQLNARANQVAHYLRSRGVGPNVRVGICLDPAFEFAIAVLAVMKSGGACVPLDPNYPQERINYMLRDVQAQVLITEKGMPVGEAPEGCEILILSDLTETLSSQSTSNPVSGVTANDIAYVIYTSGSTGKPRGVLLAHSGLVNYNTATSLMYGIGPSDRMLQFCSISFDIAVEELFCTWESGATVVLRSAEMSLAVPEFLAWVERQGITILDLPTAYWHEWVHHLSELKEPVPPSVRLVIVGGERASSKACAAWSNAVGRRVRWINTYGPTEASISVTAFEPSYAARDVIPENIPIGRPLPNCRIYLLDWQLNPVPVGVPGELHIGGVCVAQGYYNRPELTAEKFIPDPFSAEPGARLYKSGDMARYLPSGVIEFLGRGDDQVKIRGFRVELGEIETALAKHPGVREVAVLAKEDAGEKRLIAYLVPAQGAKPTPTELRHYLQQHLPDYMVPSTFVQLQTMPITPNGKVDRRGLPAPQIETSSIQIVVATDAVQSQLVRIWEEVLGRKPIGIRDNFFELGGHSLLAARLMHRIGQATGKTLPLAMLLEAPTVELLAATLRQNGWSHHWSSLVPIQPAGSHPPFFCIHGVGGNAVGFHELGRRMSPDYPLYGLQSQGLDGKRPCFKTIEEMASHYISEIRSVRPKGPYLVGGFSLGGLIAYEMAQQLRAMDEEVGLLVLFDTYPGNLKNVTASVVQLLLTPSWRHWFHDLPSKAVKRVRRGLKNRKVPQFLRDVRDSNAGAAERYTLRPYAGKATLIRAGEKSLRSSGDPHAAWPGLVSELEVHEIPGDHYEMLVAPQVEHLAERLKSCIDQSLHEHEQPALKIS
jgi:amino acid adenylation domain-containing protein